MVSPGWLKPRHLERVTDAIYRATKEPIQVCLSVPPRFAKTETISHGCAWSIERDDEKSNEIAYATYAADLALEKSRQIQDYVSRAGVPIRARQPGNLWRTHGGAVFKATGVGGPLTGRGARLLIVDDPVKNREEAESPVIRQKTWDWFTSTALTRIEPGGSIIVVHTRWHADDVIGRIERGEAGNGWEIINLPAIDSQGLSLWPERWSVEALEKKRVLVGEYDWAALFMGRPRPKGGALFIDDPEEYTVHNPEGFKYVVACDPAATEKTSADYSVILVMAYKGRPGTVDLRCDVVDVQRGQWSIPTLVKKLETTCKDWGAPAICEAVGGFKAVPQMLRQVNPSLRIFSATPSTDKFIRAQGVAAAWGNKQVRVPREASWKRPFMNEVTTFTGVKDHRDDQVDALSLGYNSLLAINQQKKGIVVPGWREV